MDELGRSEIRYFGEARVAKAKGVKKQGVLALGEKQDGGETSLCGPSA